MSYRIKLENFEGPLDLLLFFIHRDRLNIYDIPISHITSEFLEYLGLMQKLNIRVAGDFIIMAAMLMRLKAKMLLPKEKNDEDEAEDPRTDLIQRLLEYKQFKEASQSIRQMHHVHSFRYVKGMDIPIEKQKESPEEYIRHITLFDLLAVFKGVLDRMPDRTPLEVRQEQIHLDGQIEFIRTRLSSIKKLNFSRLVKGLESKIQVIVTFMALLELMKSKEIRVEQREPLGDILLESAAAS